MGIDTERQVRAPDTGAAAAPPTAVPATRGLPIAASAAAGGIAVPAVVRRGVTA